MIQVQGQVRADWHSRDHDVLCRVSSGLQGAGYQAHLDVGETEKGGAGGK